MDTPQYTWTPPRYDISKIPRLSRTLDSKPDLQFPHNFGRAGKWCPDGQAILIQCENHSLQLFQPQLDDAEPKEYRQQSAILDFAWFPSAALSSPASYCFVTSVRECPVKLIDGSDGRLRASYRIVDHRERQVAPHSLMFNPTGERLYCGFEDAIEVFDVARPGEGTRLHTTPSKKSKDGLKGIISTLSFSNSYSQSSSIFAAGSLTANSGNIALFDEEQGEAPVMFVDGGLTAGVSQLQFNPAHPHILYASYRRREEILAWDLRADVSSPLATYLPSVGPKDKTSNQRRRYDVDPSGTWLSSGRENGKISMYNLSNGQTLPDPSPSHIPPDLTFEAHEDSIGCVAFNPAAALLCSISGSRHFEDSETDSDSDSEDLSHSSKETIPTGNPESVSVRRRKNRPMPRPLDSSLKIWDFSAALDGES